MPTDRTDPAAAATCKEGRRGACVSLEGATAGGNENGKDRSNGV